MITGISTACLYPTRTEESLRALLDAGFKQFEIFFNSDSEVRHGFIAEIKVMLARYEASVSSCHLFTSGFEPLMFFSNYPRRFDDSIELYRRYSEALAETGARVVVFHGDRKESLLPLEEYAERYDRLAQAVAREGMTLAQENVSRCLSGSIHTIRRLGELLGERIRFVFDVKQAVRAGATPHDMLAAMGRNVAAVHVSDHTSGQDCLLPGAGKADFGTMLTQLREQQYDGPLIIEVYRSNFDRLGELEAAKKHMQAVTAAFIH